MIDRFGLLPEQVNNLFQVSRVRLAAQALGIRTIEAGPGGGSIEFKQSTGVDPANLVALVQSDPRTYKLAGPTRLRFEASLPDMTQRQHFLEQLLTALSGNRQGKARNA